MLWQDVLGLVTFAGMVLAVFFALRRVKSQQAAAVASARIEGIEAGKAAVLASIGSTAVVNLQLGHRFGDDSADYSANDVATLANRGGDPGRRLPDGRVGWGVPVGLHPGGSDRDVHTERAEFVESLISSDEAHRVLLDQHRHGRGPGS